MKKIALLTLLGFGFLMASAQLDTTVYRHGKKIIIQEYEDGFNIFVAKEGVDSTQDSTTLEEIGLIL